MHLEFQYLSQLTGKDIYLQKVFILFSGKRKKKQTFFVIQVEKIRRVLKDASESNMYYNYINPQTGKWCQSRSSIELEDLHLTYLFFSS